MYRIRNMQYRLRSHVPSAAAASMSGGMSSMSGGRRRWAVLAFGAVLAGMGKGGLGDFS